MEMYTTSESVEALLPVLPPCNHLVEPLEYEVHAWCWSRWLQGLHPYMYIGLSRGSRWVSPGHPPVRVCASGPSNRFPTCHPSDLARPCVLVPCIFIIHVLVLHPHLPLQLHSLSLVSPIPAKPSMPCRGTLLELAVLASHVTNLM